MSGVAGFCKLSEHLPFEKGRKLWEAVLCDMINALKRRGGQYSMKYTRPQAWMAASDEKAIDGMYNIDGQDYFILLDGTVFNADLIAPHGEPIDKTLLKGYLKQGPAFFNTLNGVYAGIIWDEAKKTLCLFRDHLGAKPMFYTVTGETIIFGSEIKALFGHPLVEPVVTADGLRELFGLGPAREPASGVFENIFSVAPGGYCLYTEGNLKTGLYWSLESCEHIDDYDKTREQVADLLWDAVGIQLRAYPNSGSFLSGGVDSSLVTAIAASILKHDGCGTLKTFSFDFEDNARFFKASSFQPELDRPYVEIMADYLKTGHTFLECDASTMTELLSDACKAHDLPCMADIASSLLFFCSEVKKSIPSALTGECADEIFCGYPWFHRKELMEAEAMPWSKDAEIRGIMLKDEILDALKLNEYMNDIYQKSVNEAPALQGETGSVKRMRQIAYLTHKYFMSTLVDRMDRTSQYSGFTALAPFADKRLVTYLWNVPWEMKAKNGEVKHLLRASFEGLLPDSILNRKKSPYPKTYNPGYEAILAQRLRAATDDQNSPIRYLIDLSKMEKFINEPADYGKPWYGQLMAGPQMLGYILQIDFWLKHYNVRIKL